VIDAEPNARFLLVGDGVLRERLQQQIAAAGLVGHFQFTGLTPPERIPELLAATDIVVHASLREGLARLLPQALIAGKPVVSYDIDGAREVVIPNQTGFLVPPPLPRGWKRGQSPLGSDGLATALKRLVADPALREQFGREGRRRFTDLFRHERMTARLRELYLKMLAGRP
jgi:glycosyltransferase involved in cell wall biosynthesis